MMTTFRVTNQSYDFNHKEHIHFGLDLGKKISLCAVHTLYS